MSKQAREVEEKNFVPAKCKWLVDRDYLNKDRWSEFKKSQVAPILSLEILKKYIKPWIPQIQLNKFGVKIAGRLYKRNVESLKLFWEVVRNRDVTNRRKIEKEKKVYTRDMQMDAIGCVATSWKEQHNFWISQMKHYLQWTP